MWSHGPKSMDLGGIDVMKSVRAPLGLAVFLAARPAGAGNEGICYQSHDSQRGVVYFYCPGGRTYVVKQDPQTGKLYEKQGVGPWKPFAPRGKPRGK